MIAEDLQLLKDLAASTGRGVSYMPLIRIEADGVHTTHGIIVDGDGGRGSVETAAHEHADALETLVQRVREAVAAYEGRVKRRRTCVACAGTGHVSAEPTGVVAEVLRDAMEGRR